ASWRTVLRHLRKGQQLLGELNDNEVRRELLESADALAQRAHERKAKHQRVHERKRKSRLLRQAAAIYRKIAE
ncbi:hypothetical protein NQ257_25660, partial [Escherichia coli]|nr:hypothetical protein [Escherichia coli]